MPFSECSIIIVTHNSELYIEKAIESLQAQTAPPSQVLIVDSGSANSSYLEKYAALENTEILLEKKDVGFCRANNLAMKKVPAAIKYVLFLNPDAILEPDFLQKAVEYMENPINSRVGAITGTILGYDIQANQPTGRYDSTGIFHTWYGRWYDRGQGELCNPQLYRQEESIPAICGAVYFSRKNALESIWLRDQEVFDNTFYMYKDDIDLSLRLRKDGWEIKFIPTLKAYHCRGWSPNRKKMPKKSRLFSAKNELRIHLRTRSPVPIGYSLCKYAAVTLFDK